MFYWLEISNKAIKSALAMEYRINSNDFPKNISTAFMEISAQDLQLLEKYLTGVAFNGLKINIRKMKKKEKSNCNFCKARTSKSMKWIRCDACLLWYHFECAGITEEKTDDWFCQDKKCLCILDRI